MQLAGVHGDMADWLGNLVQISSMVDHALASKMAASEQIARESQFKANQLTFATFELALVAWLLYQI